MSKVVITNMLLPVSPELLIAAGHRVEMPDTPDVPARDEVLARLAGASGVITSLTDSVDEDFLAAAGPELQVVANVAVGFNNIDLAACAERGVQVTNTPDVLSDTTAETAFGLLLMVSRRFGEAERHLRAGKPWAYNTLFMLGTSLQGKTLGIVGLGRIGRVMAARAKAFGMQIIYSGNRPLPPELAEPLDARFVSLEELLATSDAVSLHCPYTPATHHLISGEQLAMMKPSAYLINTARGAVIDEAALVEALQAGQLAGAGLDVYEHEPKVAPQLLTMENVVLLPHIGSATIQTRTEMCELAANNVIEVLAGRPALTPVSPR